MTFETESGSCVDAASLVERSAYGMAVYWGL